VRWRFPFGFAMASPAKGLRSISRPAFADAASLNIARKAGTVALRLPPASLSATMSSPMAAIDTLPYLSANAFVRSAL